MTAHEQSQRGAAELPPADFVTFVGEIEADLRGALLGWCGAELANDATAEALAWAWEHWAEVRSKRNPVAFLYRVAQSRSRTRKQGRLPRPEEVRLPDVEPALVPALLSLPIRQRTAVWLVHACGWTYAECGEAMGVSPSAVGTHLSRALASLRAELGSNDIDNGSPAPGHRGNGPATKGNP